MKNDPERYWLPFLIVCFVVAMASLAFMMR